MTATLPFIQKTFDRFNALCFEGVLPPVPFVLTGARSFLGKLEYRGTRGLFGLVSFNGDFRMKISTSFDLPEVELEDVVLHEMIHYYVAWRNIRDTSVHGEVFRNIMDQLNAMYGRHVTVRHKARASSGAQSCSGARGASGSVRARRYVCVTDFTDGFRGVTVAASTKVPDIHMHFTRCPDICGIRWYGTTDPFFARYPRSRTPRVYRITPEDLQEHLRNADTIRCDVQ